MSVYFFVRVCVSVSECVCVCECAYMQTHINTYKIHNQLQSYIFYKKNLHLGIQAQIFTVPKFLLYLYRNILLCLCRSTGFLTTRIEKNTTIMFRTYSF